MSKLAPDNEAHAQFARSSACLELSRDLVCRAGFAGCLQDLNAPWTQTLACSAAELRFVHRDDRELPVRRRAMVAHGRGRALASVRRACALLTAGNLASA